MEGLLRRVLVFLKEKRVTRADMILAGIFAAALLAVFGCNYFYGIQMDTSEFMDQAYSAKDGGDGTFYVLDSGHERLIHIDSSGKLLTVVVPEDVDGSYLYATDFVTEPDGTIYLAACSWDGMCVDRDVILKLDAKGHILEKLAEYDYTEHVISKSRIRGLRAEDGKLFYAYCNEDLIEIYQHADGENRRVDMLTSYDAFDSVLNVQLLKNQTYVLNKKGMIQCFEKDKETPYTVYGISSAGEMDRVPFQMYVTEEKEIYFTDIFHRTIQRVEGETSVTVVEDTDSTTVSVTPQGELVTAEFDGIRLSGETSDGTISKLTKPVHIGVLKLLRLLCKGMAAIAGLLLLLHLLGAVMQREFSRSFKFTIVLLMIIISVSGVLINILLEEFAIKYNDKVKEQLESAAYVVANQLEEDDITGVQNAADYGSGAYLRITDIMNRSYPRDNDFYRQIYCNIVVLEESGGAHAIAYLDQSIGTYFPLGEDEAKEVAKVYETGEAQWNDSRADASGTYIYVKVPIKAENNKVVGVVDVGITTEQLAQTISELKQEVFSALIVVLLLIGLLVSEISALVAQNDSYKSKKQTKALVLPGHILRLMVFAIYTAFNMSATFLPVYIMTHITDSFGMEKEFAASLPIMVNIFVMGVMSLFCSKLVQKMGMAKLAVWGGMSSVIGNLLLFAFPIYPVAFVALIMDAVGIGLLSNASYILITYVKDESDRMEGFSTYNGACISGINFGMMFGSILAVRISQRNVFLCVVVCWIVVIALTCFVGKQMEQLMDMEAGEEPDTENVNTRQFLWNKAVTPFLVLIQNPYIIFNSFVFFFVPIFCEQQGYSETTVSILLVVYSGIAILFGDKLTMVMSEKLQSKAMYLAYFINIAAVIVYAWTQNMNGLLIALLLLGLAAAFGKPVQQNYFLEMDVVKKYGEDRAMGVYNFTENIGESLGPVVFGKLMFVTPLNLIVSAFGGAVALLGAFHMFLNRRKKDGTKEIN